MSFKKNLRGAETYAPPATASYRAAYDRVFGKKEPLCSLCGEMLVTAPASLCQPCTARTPAAPTKVEQRG